ncbi:MAG: ROK family protein [Saprospiraceae bacterium]|nr:ROK family protein [Saprospiraceae bacterium]
MTTDIVQLGIDIGGTGIKGALVNIVTGELVSERFRLDTPQPSTPESVAATVKEIANQLGWKGPIGCGFPAAIQNGIVLTAANIDKSWIGVNAEELFSTVLDNDVYLINDADAAGVAEMEYGEGKGKKGVVMLFTIGTGIGSALFMDGQLVPNTELGHLYLKNKLEVVEHYSSGGARKRDGLSWKQWGTRFNRFLSHIQRLFWPQYIILSGGLSKKYESFSAQLKVTTPVVVAKMRNNAGIIGAAHYAYQKKNK